MTAATYIKRMSIQEFGELGYLQELNRGFLHPLGLAMETIILDDAQGGSREILGGVWDYRDDPEGMAFGEGEIEAEKTERIAAIREERRPARVAALGYWQQPAEGV